MSKIAQRVLPVVQRSFTKFAEDVNPKFVGLGNEPNVCRNEAVPHQPHAGAPGARHFVTPEEQKVALEKAAQFVTSTPSRLPLTPRPPAPSVSASDKDPRVADLLYGFTAGLGAGMGLGALAIWSI